MTRRGLGGSIHKYPVLASREDGRKGDGGETDHGDDVAQGSFRRVLGGDETETEEARPGKTRRENRREKKNGAKNPKIVNIKIFLLHTIIASHILLHAPRLSSMGTSGHAHTMKKRSVNKKT